MLRGNLLFFARDLQKREDCNLNMDSYDNSLSCSWIGPLIHLLIEHTDDIMLWRYNVILSMIH